MAEAHTKRHHKNDGDCQIENTKRHRSSYINEQQETLQDLSDFFTNLSSDPFLYFTQQPDNASTSNIKKELVEEDDEKERAIRHLFEASDDELGIPSRVEDGGDDGEVGVCGGGGDDIAGEEYGDFSLALCDGLWELEDEAANYYTVLQSELFINSFLLGG
ncbi:unnamed protein product [Lactuca virosa]|uniref:Uncharacterized protein n=1 Tax=Lactuca virosa TaxID=75947 RepID=A0AAU9LMG7_9ASTR|nr:unnamed protein product [Lactuca virosa]